MSSVPTAGSRPPGQHERILVRSPFLDGGDYDDVLNGWAGAKQLRGGAGHDRLFGYYGDDRLSGGEGNDQLFGGGEHALTMTGCAAMSG